MSYSNPTDVWLLQILITSDNISKFFHAHTGVARSSNSSWVVAEDKPGGQLLALKLVWTLSVLVTAATV